MVYGKYWNVGLSDTGRLGATRRQIFRLQKLDRRDYRGKGLTRDQASDLIEELEAKREQERAVLGDVAGKMYAAMMKKATQSANAAGEAWLKDHPDPLFIVNDPESQIPIGIHGMIGSAWLTWPKRGTDIYKWMLENNYDGQKHTLLIEHRHAHRLEVELLLECERAAIDVFRNSGQNIGDIRLKFRCEHPELIGRQAA
ncbi:hypothetical protein G6L37_03865 [Agrobacterium rubi]|nr:hypothetical protein [Agrobacterium rubi]NTF24486.1 hypothetical protein [Agrobacterium rubi]